MPKHKLLLMAPTYDLKGGADQSFLELILGAKKRGYKMLVVVPKKGKFFDELRRNDIETKIIDYTFWHPVFNPELVSDKNFRAIDAICKLIEAHSIDLVVTNTVQIPWGALAAAYANKPHVWITCEYPRYGSEYLIDHYDFISSFSHTIFANSRLLAEHIQKNYKLNNVSYFYSFVDENKVYLDSSIKEQRIVCVSNINSNKNQLVLVKAINKLVKRGKLKSKVILIGSHYTKDPYVKQVLDYIKKNNLSNTITLTGHAESPFSMVGPNDIFVQTSMSESIGRTLIEAIKLGLVVVGADIEGTREGFQLGGGVLFSKQDPGDLADKLAAVTSDFQKYKQQAMAARAKALKTQSEPSCHDKFFAEIDQIKVAVNPNYVLRHIRPYTTGAAQAISNANKLIKRQDQAIRNYRRELDAIYNSKAWKTATGMRKILRRG